MQKGNGIISPLANPKGLVSYREEYSLTIKFLRYCTDFEVDQRVHLSINIRNVPLCCFYLKSTVLPVH